MDANRLLKKINYLSPNDYENELEFLTKENNEKNSIAFYQRGINNFKKGLINIQKGLEKESIEIFEKTISEFTIAIELQANTKLYLFRGMAHEKIADLVEDDSLSLHHRTRAFDD